MAGLCMQVFVSEETCIGCKNCTHVCPQTFAIEDDFGRARAMRQGRTFWMLNCPSSRLKRAATTRLVCALLV